MPITSVEKDPESLTMTIVAEFDVDVRRLWDAYADPRQLERFWGPPEWPATFTRHDLVPGGRAEYHMTGPDGEKAGGYWEFLSVDAPRSFAVRDGFRNADGTDDAGLPTSDILFTFADAGEGSRVTVTTSFGSLEELEQLIGMGMDEGMRIAMAQIDAVVADLASFAAGRATESAVLSDTQVRISRIIRGTVQQVWRAHHEAALVRRWLLGPDGWTMPVCEVAESVGDAYRYEWETEDGENRFGFTGELLESSSPHREVTTERMIGTDGPSTRNELTLTPVDDGTLLTLVVTYPDAQTRDAILATGMTDGMETSYARLEAEVLQDA